jgi:hypothetical protein
MMVMSMLSLNCGHQQAYCFHPRWYISVGNHGEIISTRETPDSSIRALWKYFQQSNLVAKQERLGDGNGEFVPRSISHHTSKWFFTCQKILRHGVNGFTFLPKECVLRILIALKNESPRPVWTHKPWPNGKHANRCTIEVTVLVKKIIIR